jgi:hypothetical protein
MIAAQLKLKALRMKRLKLAAVIKSKKGAFGYPFLIKPVITQSKTAPCTDNAEIVGAALLMTASNRLPFQPVDATQALNLSAVVRCRLMSCLVVMTLKF